MKNDFQPVVGHNFNFRATPMPQKTFLSAIEKPGADHEADVRHDTPAIWQSDYAAKSAFRVAAAFIRPVLFEAQ
jgi:hypothetical protein